MPVVDVKTTRNAVYDPHSEKYWDEILFKKKSNALLKFAMAVGCVLSIVLHFLRYLMPSTIQGDGDVLKLNQEDIQSVIDQCFQCKVCYIKCPYTDQDDHVYDLNFPALMQRAVHVKARRKRVRFRDKILQDADFCRST